MKKLLILILALTVCALVFSGCELPGFMNGKTECASHVDADANLVCDNCGATLEASAVTNENLAAAIDYIELIYKSFGGKIAKNFDVTANVAVADSKYAVVWTTDNAEISIVAGKDSAFYTVTLPKDNTEEIAFKLTATITDENGESASTSFTFVVPVSTTGNVLTIPEATELGLAQGTGSYTTDKYFVSGKITKITQENFGNMSIEDEAGNSIFIYGTFDPSGNQYGNMTSNKPVVGDTITVYGVVGNYNGTAQLLDAVITVVNGTQIGENIDAAPTDMTIPEALAAAVGTKVVVKGQVIMVNQTWDAGYKNMSVTIADAEGNELYIYRMGTQVIAGDFITVTGTVGEYNSAKQIAQGATAVVTGHKDLVVDANCHNLSFSAKANRTEFDTSKQVWQQNGVTVTNNKSASTSNVADYAGPARFYASSQLIVEYSGMTKIVFDCNNKDYATALVGSIGTVSGVTVTQNNDKVTVVFASAVDSFNIAKLNAQVRMDAIDVYAN